MLSGCSILILDEPPVGASLAEREHYLHKNIDQLLDTNVDASKAGLSVIVLKDNEVVYQRSKGLANIEKGTPITSDTVFNIASITKTITAVAIMQLVEQHKLMLDDSVLKWLPELPSNWKDIQIKHLLTHQSGIPFCFTSFEDDAVGEFDGVDNKTLIQNYITDTPLLYPPGSTAKYCNIDFIILAEVIRSASGVSYTRYFNEHIFTPLDMQSTYVNTPPKFRHTTLALNYGRTPQTVGMNFAITGAMGVFSSASDLSKFVKGLLAGKLIDKETLQLMISEQVQVKSNRSNVYFGYGWFISKTEKGLYSFYHSGVADGYRSFLFIIPKSGLIVIALFNDITLAEDVFPYISFISRLAYKNSTYPIKL